MPLGLLIYSGVSAQHQTPSDEAISHTCRAVLHCRRRAPTGSIVSRAFNIPHVYTVWYAARVHSIQAWKRTSEHASFISPRAVSCKSYQIENTVISCVLILIWYAAIWRSIRRTHLCVRGRTLYRAWPHACKTSLHSPSACSRDISGWRSQCGLSNATYREIVNGIHLDIIHYYRLWFWNFEVCQPHKLVRLYDPHFILYTISWH